MPYFQIDQHSKSFYLSFAAGTFPRQVHRHGLLSAFLQTHAEQEANTQRPGVHRPRVLQLTYMDQVICVFGVQSPQNEKRVFF